MDFRHVVGNGSMKVKQRMLHKDVAIAHLFLARRFLGGLFVFGGLCYTVVLLLAASRNIAAAIPSFVVFDERSFAGPPALTSQQTDPCNGKSHGCHGQPSKLTRTRQTPADLFYHEHGFLMKPPVMHAILNATSVATSADKKGILVIGDVHGCLEELKLLYKAALKENGGISFRLVIMVGDLCVKGPDSAKVVRCVRNRPDWLAVRGNNDNFALKAAFGDTYFHKNRAYKWVSDAENGLSDDDVMYLSTLPYTITIPKDVLNQDSKGDEKTIDTTIVHAGLIPGVDLRDQHFTNMIGLREIEPILNSSSAADIVGYAAPLTENGKTREARRLRRGIPVPWASVWRGPNRVIFGHDATRGLQQYKEDWAIGIDTGAVYGKQLTGLILPGRRLVHIDAIKKHVNL